MPMSFLVMGSSKRRPISRLIAKKVNSGLVTAWRLAGWPLRSSPAGAKATMEGVVRAPSAFSITLGADPSITATQELVVPRSMPITLAMLYCPLLGAWGPDPDGVLRPIPLKLLIKTRKRAKAHTDLWGYIGSLPPKPSPRKEGIFSAVQPPESVGQKGGEQVPGQIGQEQNPGP